MGMPCIHQVQGAAKSGRVFNVDDLHKQWHVKSSLVSLFFILHTRFFRAHTRFFWPCIRFSAPTPGVFFAYLVFQAYTQF